MLFLANRSIIIRYHSDKEQPNLHQTTNERFYGLVTDQTQKRPKICAKGENYSTTRNDNHRESREIETVTAVKVPKQQVPTKWETSKSVQKAVKNSKKQPKSNDSNNNNKTKKMYNKRSIPD